MSEVVIRFNRGERATRRSLEALLINLSGRAAVAGDLVCEVDGKRQIWWDEELAEMKDQRARSLEREAEWQRRHSEMLDAIRADPTRSNEEIAEEIGCHPKAIEWRREVVART